MARALAFFFLGYAAAYRAAPVIVHVIYVALIAVAGVCAYFYGRSGLDECLEILPKAGS